MKTKRHTRQVRKNVVEQSLKFKAVWVNKQCLQKYNAFEPSSKKENSMA